MTATAPTLAPHPSSPLPEVQSPIWLQTLQSIVNPIPYLEKAHVEHGDIFVGRSWGFPPFILLNHPKAIEQVFTTDPNYFDSVSGNQIISPITGDQGLILLEGKAHQKRRKLMMPTFHGERMRAYGEAICAIATQVSQEWSQNQPFVMRSATQEITLRVILRTIFGINNNERFQQLRQLLDEMLHTFDTPLGSSHLFLTGLQKDLGPWSLWGKFLRRRQAINALLLAEIQGRRQQPLGQDILSLLLAARDEQGEPMSDAELRDELMTLLFAGHETTASALAWAFYWIHQVPEVRTKLLAELRDITPDTDPSEIAKLPYLSAVCSETLRIYPLVLFTFSRTLKQPLRVMGYDLPVGAMLTPCIYLVHHREELYPNPHTFWPGRFLERQFSPYEYFPFGGSNRRCVGYAFALFEMKLVLATILKQTSLQLVSPKPIQPVRRGITFTPAGGVPMVVTGAA
ncbi:cytochrome P450 [Acaryochloris sp. IP29b_bin.137]|uniref:cytochrome P450 n=1 Tax=Acaryochloris sp. IP29b_bin.137 TaxID=2969217 RepID=UPI0026022271|nr:cytochrome P450 [Acaryochloris sp. IP29b_bin.137]